MLLINRLPSTPIALLLALCLNAAAFGGLERQLQELIRGAGLQQTKVAAMVVDLASGEELAAINETDLMIPASNMKLVTSAAAIQLLGQGFVFRTALQLVEPKDWEGLDDMVLDGRGFDPTQGPVLVVRGDGDPAFGDPVLLKQQGTSTEQLLQDWVDAIRATGIKRFQRLLIDDRVFDRHFTHPTWPRDQLNMWYCAQVAGLNINNNCLDVFVEPTSTHQSPRVRIAPAASFLRPLNKAVTGKKDTFWISRKPHTNEVTYWGQVKTRRSAPIRVTVHDPPLFFARLLAHRLEEAGITVGSIGRPGWDDPLPVGQTLRVVENPLPVILARCNKDSHNLFAESLLKRVGRQFTGAPGGWQNGPAAVRAFLNHAIGAQGAEVMIADGSGLSRDNRITPRTLVGLLQYMYQDQTLGAPLLDSLAVGGQDGTLRKRFKKKMAGRVYGKSGYIKGVSCLSGYLIIPSPDGVDGEQPGQAIAFSLLFNEIKPPIYVHRIKNIQEQMIRIIDQEASSQLIQNAKWGG